MIVNWLLSLLLFAIFLDTIFKSLWQIYFAPKRLDPFWHVSLNPLLFLVKKDQLAQILQTSTRKNGSPAGAALFESAGGGAAAGATGGAGARHAGAETRRVVLRRVKTETEETWWWPDVVDILTCGDGRCGMMVMSLVALLFDDFWSMSQLGRLALLGVEIVLSGVVRAKGPALPPWLPRLHGFSDHDTMTSLREWSCYKLLWMKMKHMTRWHALHMKRQISSVQEIGKIVWLISLQSAKSEMAGVGSNPSQAGCLCWRLVVW